MKPTPASAPVHGRHPHWATPLPAHGVPNLHRVTPTLLRSAQPGAASAPALLGLGVRTVVSLRSFKPDAGAMRVAGLRLLRVPINTWYIRDHHVVRALDLVIEAERDGGVLMHCLHGADRTGIVSALYRIVVQGWTKDAARQEMLEGGFGYHAMWRNIPAFLERVDIAAIRAALRIAP